MDFIAIDVFAKLKSADRERLEKLPAGPQREDYGYMLYKSLEYDFKYLKNNDFNFRANITKAYRR